MTQPYRSGSQPSKTYDTLGERVFVAALVLIGLVLTGWTILHMASYVAKHISQTTIWPNYFMLTVMAGVVMLFGACIANENGWRPRYIVVAAVWGSVTLAIWGALHLCLLAAAIGRVVWITLRSFYLWMRYGSGK